MSIVNIFETPWSSKSVIQKQSSQATREFTVLVDDTDTTEVDVRDDVNVPHRGDAHPNMPGLLVDSVTIERTSSYLFKVTCNYVCQSTDEDTTPAPEGEAPEITISFTTGEVPIDTQPADDKPIMNAVGERYDPPITARRSYLVVKITRNEFSFSASSMASYIQTVNASSWNGWSAGCVLLAGVEAREVTPSDGNVYWRVTYELWINANKWTKRVLHQGFRLKVGTLTNGMPDYSTLTESDGTTPRKSPALLNADGTAEINPDSGTPVWLEWDVYASSNFSSLGLV